MLIIAFALFLGVGFTSLGNKDMELVKNLDIYYTLFRELNMFYVDETDPKELVTTSIDAMLASQSKPMPGYHFQNIDKIAEIDLESKVSRAQDHNDAIVEAGSNVRLIFAGTGFAQTDNPKPGFLEFPLKAFGALRFIVKSEKPFCVKELPDFYPDETKLLIVGKLLEEGYLKFA